MTVQVLDLIFARFGLKRKDDEKKILNNITYLLLGVVIILLLYARYLLLVNEGKAKSIEELKIMVIENIVEKI